MSESAESLLAFAVDDSPTHPWEWTCSVAFAETRGKARFAVAREWMLEWDDALALRVRRVPELDQHAVIDEVILDVADLLAMTGTDPVALRGVRGL